MDLSKIIEELRALRMEVVALQGSGPKSKSIQKTKCHGMTGKGTPCCNGAVLGTDFCKMHTGKVEKPPKTVKVPKTPKAKKIQPEHTHGIGEEVDNCELCQMHGDVLDPKLPNLEFDGNLEDFKKFLLDEEEEHINDLEVNNTSDEEEYINDIDIDNEEMGDALKILLDKHDGKNEYEDDDVSERLRLFLEGE